MDRHHSPPVVRSPRSNPNSTSEPNLNQIDRVSCKDLGVTDCEGWLYKYNDRRRLLSKDWAQRWCVLKDGNLYWYKSQDDETVRGHIFLQGFLISPVDKKEIKVRPKTPHAFKACHSGTTIYFASDRKEDRDKWMNKMSVSTVELTNVARDLQMKHNINVFGRSTVRLKPGSQLKSFRANKNPRSLIDHKLQKLHGLQKTLEDRVSELQNIEKMLSSPSAEALKIFKRDYLTQDSETTFDSTSDHEQSGSTNINMLDERKSSVPALNPFSQSQLSIEGNVEQALFETSEDCNGGNVEVKFTLSETVGEEDCDRCSGGLTIAVAALEKRESRYRNVNINVHVTPIGGVFRAKDIGLTLLVPDGSFHEPELNITIDMQVNESCEDHCTIVSMHPCGKIFNHPLLLKYPITCHSDPKDYRLYYRSNSDEPWEVQQFQGECAHTDKCTLAPKWMIQDGFVYVYLHHFSDIKLCSCSKSTNGSQILGFSVFKSISAISNGTKMPLHQRLRPKRLFHKAVAKGALVKVQLVVHCNEQEIVEHTVFNEPCIDRTRFPVNIEMPLYVKYVFAGETPFKPEIIPPKTLARICQQPFLSTAQQKASDLTKTVDIYICQDVNYHNFYKVTSFAIGSESEAVIQGACHASVSFTGSNDTHQSQPATSSTRERGANHARSCVTFTEHPLFPPNILMDLLKHMESSSDDLGELIKGVGMPRLNGTIISPRDVLSYMQCGKLADDKMEQWQKFLIYFKQLPVVPAEIQNLERFLGVLCDVSDPQPETDSSA